MGFFSRKTPLEKMLEDTHASMYAAMGMPSREARQAARELVARAKADCEAAGYTADPMPGLGDVLLRRENEDPKTRAELAIKRAEGVTDDNIRWWWNLHPLERRVMDLVDEQFRANAYFGFKDEGLSQDEAVTRVRRGFAMFLDPSDTTHASGDDRPLPYELKDRVNTWATENGMRDPERFRQRIEAASSMNALIREDIRAGRMGGHAIAVPVPRRLSEQQRDFLVQRVEYIEPIAEELWTRHMGVSGMPPQARHALNVALLAQMTHLDEHAPADPLIDLAAPFADDRFRQFLAEPDVRAGMRKLIADVRSAASSHDLESIAGIVQTALVMPVGGPSALAPDAVQAVVEAAAKLVSHASVTAHLYPKQS